MRPTVSRDSQLRSFQEVMEDHLKLSEAWELEPDLERNFSHDIVVLMEGRRYRGHAGVRLLARRLARELPGGKFEYKMVLLDQELGMLEWSARSEFHEVRDGVDSYLFREGKIVAQTIHYTLIPRSALGVSAADDLSRQ